MTGASPAWDGPNMRRVRDTDGIRHVRAGIIAGPGDTELWELCATLDDGGDLPLEITGRGSDLEAAAASILATLAMHFPAGQAAPSITADERGADALPVDALPAE